MTTAIALVCRFYGFNPDEVLAMTMRRFTIMIEEIANVLKLEMGEDNVPSQSLTGRQAFALSQRIFPRGKK